MKECGLIVECFEKGEVSVQEMSYSKLKELVKDLNPISSNGYYEGEDKSYIVLAVDNVLNNELIKFANKDSIETLVNQYGFLRSKIEKKINKIQ